MSLAAVARRSGLSEQTLSTIEQGLGNPTVVTLAPLGGALDLPRRFLTEGGSPVYVQRHDEGQWMDGPQWSERVLDEIFGSGCVRTILLRLERTAKDPDVAAPRQPGTLHHVYVITGRLRTGPVTDQSTSAPETCAFPGDIPHRHVCLSDQ
jgi:transcriptional regulator with XRE-family HTH domain